MIGLVHGSLAQEVPARPTAPAVSGSARADLTTDRTQVQRMVALADPLARLAVAVATEDYPITPGDVYTLTYLTAGQPVAYDVVVQSDYTIDLRLFGRVTGQRKTFHQLRREAESIIAAAYPSSAPALNIRSVGIFPVLVKGAVKQPGRVIAWGLSRLSEIVRESLEPHGSDRDVEVVSTDGRHARYDLYKAFRFGDETQDPLVRAGETVIVSESERTVTVAGEVRRPGVYRLTNTDAATDLLRSFCGGFTPSADTSRVRLTRQNDRRIDVSYAPLERILATSLRDGDSITVPAKAELLPVVTFEGAVRPTDVVVSTPNQLTAYIGEPYGTLQVPITPGETLFSALTGIKDRLSSNADLAGAAILRRNRPPVPVDLSRLINEYTLESDPVLEPYDRIVIPSTRYFVTVSGAVVNPGSYYYTPGRSPSYYVALAGGIDPERNADGGLVVMDSSGSTLPADSAVPPGGRVIVPPNNFVYNFNRYFPIITTTLAFVTTVITVIDLLAR